MILNRIKRITIRHCVTQVIFEAIPTDIDSLDTFEHSDPNVKDLLLKEGQFHLRSLKLAILNYLSYVIYLFINKNKLLSIAPMIAIKCALFLTPQRDANSFLSWTPEISACYFQSMAMYMWSFYWDRSRQWAFLPRNWIAARDICTTHIVSLNNCFPPRSSSSFIYFLPAFGTSFSPNNVYVLQLQKEMQKCTRNTVQRTDGTFASSCHIRKVGKSLYLIIGYHPIF